MYFTQTLFLFLVTTLTLSNANNRTFDSIYKFALETKLGLRPTSHCTCVPFYLCGKYDALAASVESLKTNCAGVQVCCLPQYHVNTSQFHNVNKPAECGLSSSLANEHRHGLKSKHGDFPWTVAIFYSHSLICAGTLIHPQVVLTAASCIKYQAPLHRLVVRAGEWDMQTKREFIPHQDRNITAYFKIKNSLRRNLAMLRLEFPVIRSLTVNTICIPWQKPHRKRFRLPIGCFASGWGKDFAGERGRYQTIMKRMRIKVEKHENNNMNKTMTVPKIKRKLTLFARGKVGVCEGDVGAGLVCPLNDEVGQFELVGVALQDFDCTRNSTFSVFIRWSAVRKAIKRKMLEWDLLD